MTVIELWNTFTDWSPYTIVDLATDGGDAIGTYDSQEDVLARYGKETVNAFGYCGTTDTLTLAIEV